MSLLSDGVCVFGVQKHLDDLPFRRKPRATGCGVLGCLLGGVFGGNLGHCTDVQKVAVKGEPECSLESGFGKKIEFVGRKDVEGGVTAMCD